MTVYKVGDTVWLASCGVQEVSVPCSVCFGKRAVRVELGDGTLVETPCDYCGHGCREPTGVEVLNEWKADAKQIVIDRVQQEDGPEGVKVEYRFGGCYIAYSADVFDTQADADARCEVKTAEHNAEESARREHCKHAGHKSYSWNVGYYRREIKALQKRIAWNEARAVVCKALSKEA